VGLPVTATARILEPLLLTRAILAGDILFARASLLVASLGPEMVAHHARTFERLCEGQLNETKASSVTVPKQSLQTCLSVRVHRKGGSESPATRQCVSTP